MVDGFCNQTRRKSSKTSTIDPQLGLNLSSIQLPLFGRRSIAKSLTVKTEVSSKLSNMLAISANSDNKKSSAGKDATPFGVYNKDFINRYSPQTISISTDEGVPEGEYKAATAFNTFVNSFYRTDKPKMDSISAAINYYVERLNNKKTETPATRSSALIPISINFTTDGISGFSMGHAFTVPPEILPNTYTRFADAEDKVGFVVVGLDHTISNNFWETSVRANMLYLKDQSDFVDIKTSFNANKLVQGYTNTQDPMASTTVNSNSGGGGGSTGTAVIQPVGCTRDATTIIESYKSTIDNVITYAKKYGLTGKYAIASLVGIAGGETGFRPRDEGHVYKEANLRSTFKGLTDDQVARATKKGITKKEFFSIVYGEYNPKRVGNYTVEDGGKYYGRGFIQLTGKDNYKKYGDLAGVDLISNPDLVNDTGETGIKIAVAYFKDRIKIDQNSENYLSKALPAVGRDVNGGYAKKTAIHNCILSSIT